MSYYDSWIAMNSKNFFELCNWLVKWIFCKNLFGISWHQDPFSSEGRTKIHGTYALSCIENSESISWKNLPGKLSRVYLNHHWDRWVELISIIWWPSYTIFSLPNLFFSHKSFMIPNPAYNTLCFFFQDKILYITYRNDYKRLRKHTSSRKYIHFIIHDKICRSIN